jgi:hypothetical protein
VSILLYSKQFRSHSTQAPIEFEHSGRSKGLFTRYLTLHGKRAYELSFSCGTCHFLFERMDGARMAVQVNELVDVLRKGVRSLDTDIIDRVSSIIPEGNYVVTLLELTPSLVDPRGADDYFSQEVVSLWGVHEFWGLPHYPKTQYFRSLSRRIGDGRALFEFEIPMIPRKWLHKEAWEAYVQEIASGQRPTAIAISVLDVKQPADWEGDPAVNEHWCLGHFLLDGHHKMYAAASVGKPLTLLSFLAVEECIAREEQIDHALALLS